LSCESLRKWRNTLRLADFREALDIIAAEFGAKNLAGERQGRRRALEVGATPARRRFLEEKRDVLRRPPRWSGGNVGG